MRIKAGKGFVQPIKTVTFHGWIHLIDSESLYHAIDVALEYAVFTRRTLKPVLMAMKSSHHREVGPIRYHSTHATRSRERIIFNCLSDAQKNKPRCCDLFVNSYF